MTRGDICTCQGPDTATRNRRWSNAANTVNRRSNAATPHRRLRGRGRRPDLSESGFLAFAGEQKHKAAERIKELSLRRGRRGRADVTEGKEVGAELTGPTPHEPTLPGPDGGAVRHPRTADTDRTAQRTSPRHNGVFEMLLPERGEHRPKALGRPGPGPHRRPLPGRGLGDLHVNQPDAGRAESASEPVPTERQVTFIQVTSSAAAQSSCTSVMTTATKTRKDPPVQKWRTVLGSDRCSVGNTSRKTRPAESQRKNRAAKAPDAATAVLGDERAQRARAAPGPRRSPGNPPRELLGSVHCDPGMGGDGRYRRPPALGGRVTRGEGHALRHRCGGCCC